MYAAANFDEEIFDDPTEFRIDRKPNRHLAFGTGPHQCLGTASSRAWRCGSSSRSSFHASSTSNSPAKPEHLRASFVHGFKHLPIRFKLKPAA